MSAAVLNPVRLALTTVLQDVTTPTPVGKVRSWNIRFANVGAADAYADLIITDGTTVITRAKNYPIPYQKPGSAPDMEYRLELPAGWKIQAKASANLVVEASGVPIEADASDFVNT